MVLVGSQISNSLVIEHSQVGLLHFFLVFDVGTHLLSQLTLDQFQILHHAHHTVHFLLILT